MSKIHILSEFCYFKLNKKKFMTALRSSLRMEFELRSGIIRPPTRTARKSTQHSYKTEKLADRFFKQSVRFY